jgi:putative heme-binding domain-containing protein
VGNPEPCPSKCQLLDAPGNKLSREALYEAVLAPSAAISHGYDSYVAVLADDSTVPGLVLSKTPDTVPMRGIEGTDVSFDAADVEELRRQPLPLVPADLAATLTVAEPVSWLETLRATR